jgi:chromosome segregation protein
LQEQATQWASRSQEAHAELENLSELELLGEEKNLLLSAQVEDQSQQLPDLEEALRLAQRNANETTWQCGAGSATHWCTGSRAAQY